MDKLNIKRIYQLKAHTDALACQYLYPGFAGFTNIVVDFINFYKKDLIKVNSLPNDLHQHPFSAAPVELPGENLLLGAEVQFAFGDGHHHFPAPDLLFIQLSIFP
jgi:hypothetical protein